MASFIKQTLFPRPSTSSASSSQLSLATDAEQTAFLSGGYDTEKSVEEPHQSARSRSSRIDPRIVSDAIIGLSDGLTVPFALTAGLSALGNTHVVIYGGLAELIAGSISMGLGGYLGAKSEAESYYATQADLQRKMMTSPDAIAKDVEGILSDFGLPNELAVQVRSSLMESSEDRLLSFLMRQQHCLPEPPTNRAISCALTIALGYFVGGFVPLLPYFFVAEDDVRVGLLWSAIVIVATLFAFGYAKTGVVHGWNGWRNVWKASKAGGEMVAVGSVAAGAAMGLVVLFSGGGKPTT